MEREISLIENNKKFTISFFLLFLLIIITIPFPHAYSLGEALFMKLNIPTRIFNGFHTVGLISLLLLIVGMYILVQSLKKYRIRIALLTLLIIFIAPVFLVGLFQKTFATGIYAVSYEAEESYCEFSRIDDVTLLGVCELIFKNNRNEPVTFSIEFYEEPDDIPMVSLMNRASPYLVSLNAKEEQLVVFEAEIDVSGLENYVESGNAQWIQIIIEDNGKRREL